jgi:hypothetical protein
MKAARPGISDVPAKRWQQDAVRHCTELSDHVGLTFEPALPEPF